MMAAFTPAVETPALATATESAPQNHATWVILGAALLARLTVLWIVIRTYPHQWIYGRGVEMGLLANSLLHGQGYSSPFGSITGPTAFIAPGYPTIIAGIFRVFGIYSFASSIAIQGMQILLGLLTVWLMMHVARAIFDDRTAKIAGWFWALSLPLLWIPTIFWETSFSACAVVGMIAFALRCRKQPLLGIWIGVGVYCAVIGLINPALLPSLLAICVWASWARHQQRSILFPVVGLITFLIVFSPWPVRNAYRFHTFIPLRSTVGFELWMGNRPGATGYLDESVFPMFNKAELARYVAMGEVAYTREKSDLARAYIVAHPGTFLTMSLRRFVRFWSGTGNLAGSPFYLLHAGLTTVLGFAGLALLVRRGDRRHAILLGLPLLLFPLPYYITHAEFRYRLNIDPVMTLLAAYAVACFVATQATKDPLPTGK